MATFEDIITIYEEGGEIHNSILYDDKDNILIMILKSILYKKEQEEILVKLMNILELDENNSITLYDLDNDITKQQNIMILSNDIKKYFRFECIKGIRNPETVKRPFLSIIKNICKMKYNILSYDVRIDINNNTIRTKKYIFLKKR
jgi:hypothetical protein